jgi:3-methylcrotonyl-CoA carboxylase beta subunit
MDVLESRVDTSSKEFCERRAAMEKLVAELREEIAKARPGGPGRERHAEQKKMFVRDRVDALLDSGSPFLELSPLAAHGMYDGEAPGAGLVTGIGRVSEREVMVVANDATVKGGTY